ncbi:hypothetical protein N7468_010502 [Penicillium chermesinum]|uniref:Uncharacterized protein n=1 Tax=Penicillium chermesinum TaxID=63820 RepID=A0A9W9N9A9_9EURO|nr:uncharacterized protein N7468_010502 [Penicillium chermesinum]KAJ5214823.1 hypothetical protein N7468_010502 [Penicillium chermesinum]
MVILSSRGDLGGRQDVSANGLIEVMCVEYCGMRCVMQRSSTNLVVKVNASDCAKSCQIVSSPAPVPQPYHVFCGQIVARVRGIFAQGPLIDQTKATSRSSRTDDPMEWGKICKF